METGTDNSGSVQKPLSPVQNTKNLSHHNLMSTNIWRIVWWEKGHIQRISYRSSAVLHFHHSIFTRMVRKGITMIERVLGRKSIWNTKPNKVLESMIFQIKLPCQEVYLILICFQQILFRQWFLPFSERCYQMVDRVESDTISSVASSFLMAYKMPRSQNSIC